MAGESFVVYNIALVVAIDDSGSTIFDIFQVSIDSIEIVKY